MDTMQRDIRKSTGWSMALSVLMIVSGVLAIVVPSVAGLAVTAMFGWLLLFTGVLHLGFAWREQGAWAVIGEIVISVLYAVAGLYLLTRPLIGLASLTIVLSVYLVAKGFLEAVVAFSVRPAPGSGWLIFDAILTVAIAAMIAAAWPASTVWAIGLLVGVAMISSGFTRLMIASTVRDLVS
jgi:uncharacterized membrane protein HdeD (DUF308 family)